MRESGGSYESLSLVCKKRYLQLLVATIIRLRVASALRQEDNGIEGSAKSESPLITAVSSAL
jgi:hypothetical protein